MKTVRNELISDPQPRADLAPETIADLAACVREQSQVIAVGGGTKLAAAPEGARRLGMSAISGIVEYRPEEYTFTARAGTPLREVVSALRENDQYLPFDPPLAAEGATLGGAVAAGLSGPRGHRYGLLRDFILDVQFVDGTGTVIRGGAKVVKNAAGFDFPKLMCGSLGRLGILTEVTFKVFPRPRDSATLECTAPAFADGLARLSRLNRSAFVLDSLELEASGHLWIRLGGNAEAFPARIQRLEMFLEQSAATFSGEHDRQTWENIRDFRTLAGDGCLVKIPVTPARIRALDAALAAIRAPRRYGHGGAVAWARWPASRTELDALAKAQHLSALIFRGNGAPALVGESAERTFIARIKRALDPYGKFPPYP